MNLILKLLINFSIFWTYLIDYLIKRPLYYIKKFVSLLVGVVKSLFSSIVNLFSKEDKSYKGKLNLTKNLNIKLQEHDFKNYEILSTKTEGLDKGFVCKSKINGEIVFIKEANVISNFNGQFVTHNSFDSNKFIVELFASSLYKLYLGNFAPDNYAIRGKKDKLYIASKEIKNFRDLFSYLGYFSSTFFNFVLLKNQKAIINQTKRISLIKKSDLSKVSNMEQIIAACVLNFDMDWVNPSNIGIIKNKHNFHAVKIDHGCAFDPILMKNFFSYSISPKSSGYEDDFLFNYKICDEIEKFCSISEQHLKYSIRYAVDSIKEFVSDGQIQKFYQKHNINLKDEENILKTILEHREKIRKFAYILRVKTAYLKKDYNQLVNLFTHIPEFIDVKEVIQWPMTDKDNLKARKNINYNQHHNNFLLETEINMIIKKSLTQFVNQVSKYKELTSEQKSQLDNLLANNFQQANFVPNQSSVNQNIDIFEQTKNTISNYRFKNNIFADTENLTKLIDQLLKGKYSVYEQSKTKKFELRQICSSMLKTRENCIKENKQFNIERNLAKFANFVMCLETLQNPAIVPDSIDVFTR